MPHNPTRVAHSGTPRKVRHVYPQAGTRISDLTARNSTYRLHNEDLEKREETPWGFKVVHYRNDVFEVLYTHMCANNFSGMMIHENGDRIITVLSGKLYLGIEEEESVIVMCDKTCTIKAGVAYSLATDGSLDAELLITQPANYDELVVYLTDDTSYQKTSKKEIQNPYLSIQRPARSQVTERQAQLLKEQREASLRGKNTFQQGKPMPAMPEGAVVPNTGLDTPAGQVVVGVNPMPIGARGSL